MNILVICFVLCNVRNTIFALNSEETAEVTERCCSYGEALGIKLQSVEACSKAEPPEVTDEETDTCVPALRSCCKEQFRLKDECAEGIKLADLKQCSAPKTDIGKTCCDKCILGKLEGSSSSLYGCGELTDDFFSSESALGKQAFHQCCMKASQELETTTEKQEVTTRKQKEKCKETSCAHICNEEDGIISCQCRTGYRLQSDKRSCEDINECAEATNDLCTVENTVCHNIEGSYKCVPINKREVNLSCPPGFKRNVINQVCDDINECQLPRPPCPKYLCENTIGGYKCAGKQGKPFEEESSKTTTELSAIPAVKNDICPYGFVPGEDDDCLDIDECEARLDDCQRLSQYCINTHGSYFCQDHVSKRCSPGFKVNAATGICEDIDECEESSEVCKRNEVCVNLPGAYNCKSKISTLPKLVNNKVCQEGTRLRPGGAVCEDIDECRERTHLCDQFQNCINTFGGHECRCKSGFELDFSTGSCVDIDECALKLDNCAPGTICLNVLGSFTCTRPNSTTTSTTPSPIYEYEYYEFEEDNATDVIPDAISTTSTTQRPTTSTSPPTTSTTTRRPFRTHPTRRHPNSRYNPTTTSTTPLPDEYDYYYSGEDTNTKFTPETTSTTLPPTTSTLRPSTSTIPPTTSTLPPTTTTSTVPPTTSTSTLPPTTSTATSTTPRPSRIYPNRRNPNYPSRTNASRPTYTNRNRNPYYPSRYPTTSTTPRPTYHPRRPNPVDIGSPTDINTIETDKAPDGSYSIDTDIIPKDRWTNVIGREPEAPKLDPKLLNCLPGYEKSERGDECIDIDECEDRHICSSLEVCANRPGGYICECIRGFRRDVSGWCAPIIPTTERTTSSTTTTTIAPTTTSTSTTSAPTTVAISSPSDWSNLPRRNWYDPRTPCELGYEYSTQQGRCIDIDECATNKANCGYNEDCVNKEGGYQCLCGWRCIGHYTPDAHPRVPPVPESNVITIGAQYGKRGPRHQRPTYTRLPHTGAIVSSCPWGYKLTPEKRCLDIDECARAVSDCGPQQTCENFFGGYLCQCPAGHRLVGKQCEDVDECNYGTPCPQNARCANTVGSYRCDCEQGFRNPVSNNKACEDIDECSETSNLCEHRCSNAWGGYRCYCNRGYRLNANNRTCDDIDECAEWARSRNRGQLCAGQCVNTAGSYRCSCPAGYRISDDSRSCIDIDECENGSAQCEGEGAVCQNTRGSYHCHHIKCPPGYRLEDKHRCARIQMSCRVSDWDCLQQPTTYSYNFVTFVSHIYLPNGSVNLFSMSGPSWVESIVNFEMKIIDVQAPPGVQPADLSCFDMRPTSNTCVISLLCSLAGPQVAELELTMTLYQRAVFAGSAVARLVVIVSENDF